MIVFSLCEIPLPTLFYSNIEQPDGSDLEIWRFGNVMMQAK
jgi:hypothetical protein